MKIQKKKRKKIEIRKDFYDNHHHHYYYCRRRLDSSRVRNQNHRHDHHQHYKIDKVILYQTLFFNLIRCGSMNRYVHVYCATDGIDRFIFLYQTKICLEHR